MAFGVGRDGTQGAVHLNRGRFPIRLLSKITVSVAMTPLAGWGEGIRKSRAACRQHNDVVEACKQCQGSH